MKQRMSLTKFLINVIVVLVVSLIGFNLLRHTSFYRTSDQEVYGFFSMVRYGLFEYPAETVSNFSKDYLGFWEKRGENDALRRYVVSVAEWEVKEKMYLDEIETLRALNDLDTVYTDIELIAGRVIDRSFETWNKVLTINIGSNDGVAVDDGVITTGGMVGKVLNVNETTSLITLLTSNDEFSKISVVIEVGGQSVNGIINNYDYETQTFDILLMDSNENLDVGQKIVTSGLGGHFPKGIYFGDVSEVKQVAEGVGVIVKSKSNANFNAIDYIKVVKAP